MDISPTEPSEIIKGLWVGDMFTAKDPEFFRSNNIGAVLNCTLELPNYFVSNNIEYLRLSVNDILDPQDAVNMRNYLPVAVWFLYKNHDMEGKNVFIHCHRGVQRSVTSCVAYLYKTRHRNLKEVINYVVSKRNIAYFGGHQNNFEEVLNAFCS